MKKVIFVCLLTLSVCLGQPTADSGNKTIPEAAAPSPTNLVPKETGNNTTDPPKEPAKAAAHNETVAPPTNGTVKPDNGTVVPSNATNGKNDTHTTVKPTETPTQSTPTAPTTPPTKGTTLTPSTPKVSSTAKPVVSTATPPTLQARGFDGASFVGGIILTLGLLAIGFMGFKYYKNQTERNYHTL